MIADAFNWTLAVGKSLRGVSEWCGYRRVFCSGASLPPLVMVVTNLYIVGVSHDQRWVLRPSAQENSFYHRPGVKVFGLILDHYLAVGVGYLVDLKPRFRGRFILTVTRR
jgi:hypothetical protein